MRSCSVCGTPKPLDEFYEIKTRGTHMSKCKDCHRAAVSDHDKVRDRVVKRKTERQSHLKRTYGLSMDQFNAMVAAQDGRCIICQRVVDKLAVDHNHDTGEIRELLCLRCNSGIGLLGDDPAVLQRAIEYLNKHAAFNGT